MEAQQGTGDIQLRNFLKVEEDGVYIARLGALTHCGVIYFGLSPSVASQLSILDLFDKS